MLKIKLKKGVGKKALAEFVAVGTLSSSGNLCSASRSNSLESGQDEGVMFVCQNNKLCANGYGDKIRGLLRINSGVELIWKSDFGGVYKTYYDKETDSSNGIMSSADDWLDTAADFMNATKNRATFIDVFAENGSIKSEDDDDTEATSNVDCSSDRYACFFKKAGKTYLALARNKLSIDDTENKFFDGLCDLNYIKSLALDKCVYGDGVKGSEMRPGGNDFAEFGIFDVTTLVNGITMNSKTDNLALASKLYEVITNIYSLGGFSEIRSNGKNISMDDIIGSSVSGITSDTLKTLKDNLVTVAAKYGINIINMNGVDNYQSIVDMKEQISELQEAIKNKTDKGVSDVTSGKDDAAGALSSDLVNSLGEALSKVLTEFIKTNKNTETETSKTPTTSAYDFEGKIYKHDDVGNTQQSTTNNSGNLNGPFYGQSNSNVGGQQGTYGNNLSSSPYYTGNSGSFGGNFSSGYGNGSFGGFYYR